MTKTQIISARILTLTANGMNVKDACREVLGADLFGEMIDTLYHQLREIHESQKTS